MKVQTWNHGQGVHASPDLEPWTRCTCRSRPRRTGRPDRRQRRWAGPAGPGAGSWRPIRSCHRKGIPQPFPGDRCRRMDSWWTLGPASRGSRRRRSSDPCSSSPHTPPRQPGNAALATQRHQQFTLYSGLMGNRARCRAWTRNHQFLLTLQSRSPHACGDVERVYNGAVLVSHSRDTRRTRTYEGEKQLVESKAKVSCSPCITLCPDSNRSWGLNYESGLNR